MNSVLASPVDPILRIEKWEVREMVLTWEKVDALWQMMARFTTLFSDLTRGDFQNFFKVITSQQSLWFEIWEGEELVGMLWMTDMAQTVDASAHMAFFDRKPAEKEPVVRALIRWVFDKYPLHRITVGVPRMYHATHRLVERLGFRREGTKREAVMIHGKWDDIKLYGLLRSQQVEV
jgi:hypothetical protein